VYRFKNSLMALIGVVTLIVVTTVLMPHMGYGSSGTGSNAPTSQTQNVNVVNTPAVNAQQSGTWNVGINGTPNVNVANMPTVGINSSANTVKIDPANSLSVRDVDNAARHPFHVGTNPSLGIPDGSNVATAEFDVPAGKTAVTEYLSVLTLVGSGQRPLVLINAKVGELFSQTYVPSTFQLTQYGYDWWIASQQVRLYADPGAATYKRTSCARHHGASRHCLYLNFRLPGGHAIV